MGSFSWMFADKPEKSLKIGHKGYILCPDNTYLLANPYEGYGIFEEKDVYELVVDWNRKWLVSKLQDENHVCNITADVKMLAFKAQESDEAAREWVKSYYRKDNYMQSGWKRCLGICLACYNKDNASLPYPIKIVSVKKNNYYDNLPASCSDKNQGM